MNPQPLKQIRNDAALQPAMPAHGDQNRAMKSQTAPLYSRAARTIRQKVIGQEGLLVHIPKPAVTDRRGEPIVESDAPRGKRRPPAIAKEGNAVLVNIV